MAVGFLVKRRHVPAGEAAAEAAAFDPLVPAALHGQADVVVLPFGEPA